MIHFFYEHSSRPNNTVEMTIDEDSSIPDGSPFNHNREDTADDAAR